MALFQRALRLRAVAFGMPAWSRGFGALGRVQVVRMHCMHGFEVFILNSPSASMFWLYGHKDETPGESKELPVRG